MWLLFAALIFPLSVTLWVETTFYNNFSLVPSLTSFWDHLGKDESDYIAEPGRASQSSKRGPTCRVASPPSCVLHSPDSLLLVRADSLAFACCCPCHKVHLPPISKEPTHGNSCCGWLCALPEPLIAHNESITWHHWGSAKLAAKTRRRVWHGFYVMLQMQTVKSEALCFWGKSFCPLKVVFISQRLQVLVL